MEKKPHILAYDALRVFAIFTVILIHAFMPSRDLGQTSALARVDDGLHYAVPLLVFLSGALLWSRPWRPGSFKAFARRRAARVLPSYFAWSAVFIALLYAGLPGSGAIYAQEYNWNGLATQGVSWVTNLLRAPGYLLTGHSWYHLYFIPMIFTFYLLTPVFARLMRAWSWSAELTVIGAFALKLIVWPVLSPVLNDGNPFVFSYAAHLFQHLPHMALGGWFGLRFDAPVRADATTQKERPALAGLSLGTLPQKLSVVGQLAVLVIPARLLEPLWRKVSRPLQALSNLSFGAYYVHALYILVAQKVTLFALSPEAWRAWWMSWNGIAATWALVAFASFFTSWLLSKSPRLRWLIGA